MKKHPLVLVLSLFSFGFFAVMAIAGLSVLDLRDRSASSPESSGIFSSGDKTRIGVVEVTGVIMDSKKLVERLKKFEESTNIKGVIIRINSPGGAVAPSQEVYDAIKRLNAKKPVYASMGSVAASGGYYVALGAKRIFADPGTLTGSIGVIMQFMDMSKLYQWAKVSPYNVKTGKFKDIGTAEREMSVEEKALLQELLDNVLGQFRKAVVEARNLPLDRVIELSDGRIYSGEQAKAVRLVDEMGGLYETAEALTAELKGKKHQLIYPNKDRRMLIEKLFESADDSEDSPYGEESRFLSGLLKMIGIVTADPSAVGGAAATDFTSPGLMYLLPMGR